jgi:multidrug efflux pump subunit AcrB
VDPLEERLGELDDLDELRTTIQDGLATLVVEFDPSSDEDRKYDAVTRELNALRPLLPPELAVLEVRKGAAKDVNIVQMALVSETAPAHELERQARLLEERLENVAGVMKSERWAIAGREVRVALDLGRLATLGIPPTRVLGAIQGDNANIPGGSVDVGERRFNVKTSGRYRALGEIAGTVVGSANGRLVRVGDVADVQWGYADATHLGRFNGRRAVFVSANQRPGQNIQTVRDAIHAAAAEFERTLPAGIALERGFDQSLNVQERIGRLTTDFVIAIALVLVTLLPLGFRASAIVMISIPLSLLMGIALLYFTGFGINQLSIVGAVIALGLLVDDSIVVVENIARFLREGHSRRDAAILATRQIWVAVIGCTATLILAFVPLMFLPGLAGKYIRVLPMTVVYTVLASLFVSLTVIPWLASLLMKREADHEGNRFLKLLNRTIGATYAPVLHRALARPRTTLAVAAGLFVGALGLVPAVGFSLFPPAQTPQFRVEIEAPEGASLDATDAAARFAERELGARPEVKAVLTNVGHGNPQVYYNVFMRGDNPRIGELLVLLHRYEPATTPALFDTLRARFAAYPAARIELKEYENGPPIEAPIAIRVLGENLDTLAAVAARVERVMRETAGTQYVRNPVALRRTDLRVAVDRQKAGLLGVSTLDVDRTVRLGLAGLDAGVFRADDGEDYDIVVRAPLAGRPGVDALDRVYVSSVTGAMVPLKQVADVAFETSPTVILHQDKQRSMTVTSYVRSGFNTDRVTKEILAKLDGVAVPAGYRLVAAGEIESRQESFGGIGSAVIVAVFLILAILVLEFRTFKSTLIVASVIPLGVVGGILALWLTGYTLSFMSMIGFVALVGIEIKTSILLVDFTNQLRAEGATLDEAIEKAGQIRFVPIVLTSATAIGGLLPLALQGSALYSPLAWVIIGGLISSTLLARLVTPVMYKLLAPAVHAVGAVPAPRPTGALVTPIPAMGD